MRFSQVAKLVKEELKGKTFDVFLEKFLAGYNSLLDQQNLILNKNLTINDNLMAKTYDFSNILGNVGARTLSWPFTSPPTNVTMTRLGEVSGTVLTTAPWLLWSYDSAQSQITVEVKGLVAASTYNIRIYAQV